MGRNAVSCSTFLCPACTLQESNLHITSTKAHEGARRLVMLEGSTLAVSSQDTYASALRRYTKCMAEVYMISEQEALPPGPKEQVPLTFVKLFMGWAAGHFKPATITTTVSALAEWHRSKGLELHTLNSRVVAQLSQAIRVYQGAKGVSSGKQGLCKALIIKCLEAMRELKTLQPHMEDLVTRDAAWLVIGSYVKPQDTIQCLEKLLL
eukprot:gene22981-biopygen31594